MGRYKLELMIAIEGCILAVYYSSSKCYQFAIIDGLGEILKLDEIFYTKEAAEKSGREAVKELLC